jgi:hypothetical protein
MEGLGSVLASATKRLMASWSEARIALIQDAEVGVKWKVQCGWRPSHWMTLGCLWARSCRRWRAPADAVGVMTPLPDDQRGRHEVAFTLSFEYPGKARRRTPDNWVDFDSPMVAQSASILGQTSEEE